MEQQEHDKGVFRATWKLRRVKVVRRIIRDNKGDEVPGPEVRKPLSHDEIIVAKLNIRGQILRLRRLKDIVAKSSLRVEKNHAALVAVTEVTTRMRERIVAYPFFKVWQFYEAGVRSFKKLRIISGMNKFNFSREVNRLGWVLEHGKDGPKTNLTLDQEIREKELTYLDGFKVADLFMESGIKKLKVKKNNQEIAAWQEAMAVLSESDQDAEIERKRRAHEEKWAKKFAEYEARQRSEARRKKV